MPSLQRPNNLGKSSCIAIRLHENDLACHASFAKQLLRLSRFGKSESLRDQGGYFFLSKKFKQGDQIMSEPCRLHAFQPLNAVGNHPSSAWEDPSGRNVQPEYGNWT